jgi:23S rRNA pseudouridine955/2504/2580 synthase
MNRLRKELEPSRDAAANLEIDADLAGQRVDNYLFRLLKGVPKSHVYQILRTGQVRVNSRRVSATYRLQAGDRLRVPPIRTAERPASEQAGRPAPPTLSKHVLLEDDWLLVLNKPAGVAAHGGSGISRGVIEQLRLERPELRFLELVHRLDRDTSGVLLLAKKRGALVALHEQIRAGSIGKWYAVLVSGRWRNARQAVKLSLTKFVTASGERRVSVDEEGLDSHTVFTLMRTLPDFSLLEAELKTGRTHQIRVHLAHLGFPIAGDDKYGDFALNKTLARRGLKRMFLHAARIQFEHPGTAHPITLEADLPEELSQFLSGLAEPGVATPIPRRA